MKTDTGGTVGPLSYKVRKLVDSLSKLIPDQFFTPDPMEASFRVDSLAKVFYFLFCSENSSFPAKNATRAPLLALRPTPSKSAQKVVQNTPRKCDDPINPRRMALDVIGL